MRNRIVNDGATAAMAEARCIHAWSIDLSRPQGAPLSACCSRCGAQRRFARQTA